MLRSAWGAMRALAAADGPGTRRRRLFVRTPFPPLGRFAVAEPWPFSVSAEGALAWTVAAPNPGARGDSTGRFVRFEGMEPVRAEGRDVVVGGSRFVRLDSPASAARWAGRLEAVRRSAPAERERAAREAMRASLEVREARERFARLLAAERPTRWAANLLFVGLFVVVPVTVRLRGLAGTWPQLLAGVLLLTIATAILHRRARRAVDPAARTAGETLSIVLAPPAAIRAVDLLWRDAFAGRHPAAAAIASGSRDAEAWARAALRDALHPLPWDDLGLEDAAREVAGRHHERLVAALQDLLRSEGIDPEIPERPRGPLCPRCATSYRDGTAECADCRLPLERGRDASYIEGVAAARRPNPPRPRPR